MNKILPSQANWSPQTFHPSRQQEDFAGKLHAKQQRESGRAIVDRGATAKGSIATASQAKHLRSPSEEGEKSTAPGATVPVLEPGSAGISDGPGPTLAPGTSSEGTFTPSIGLLPGMLTWSRVYPEHLIASGYLSVVDTAAHGNVPSGQAAWVGSDADTPGSDMGTTTPMIDSNPDGAGAVADFLLDESRQPIANAGAVAGADPRSEVASSARELDASMLADHFWAERLMRLTHDGDGQNTVWLRDYRLQADDFESVAEQLRERGQQEGVPIGRVVINGREVWRAAISKGEH